MVGREIDRIDDQREQTHNLTIIQIVAAKETLWRWLSQAYGGKQTDNSRHSGQKVVLVLSFVAVHQITQRFQVVGLRLVCGARRQFRC